MSTEMTPQSVPAVGRFAGRVALVTGAAHGIGLAIATRLHTEGAAVALVDRDGEAARAAATDLGERTLGLSTDVTDQAGVDAAVAATVERFGALDVLIGNVGVAGGLQFEQTDDAAWDRQVEPTLRGAVRAIRAALPHLLCSAHAAVVLTGSVNGLSAFGDVPYSAAKAGLSSMVQNLAFEFGAGSLARTHPGAHPIRCNVVAPGTIRTRVWDDRPRALATAAKLYPLGRVGEPADVAAAVAFLASDDAAWITGTTLPVDGGVLAAGHRQAWIAVVDETGDGG